MARNSSGTYTLPAGNPVVTATTISTTWANTTLGDLAAELTDSLSRSGKGGVLAVLRGIDGTVAAPAYSFTSEVGSGLYRAGTGDVRLALGGADVAAFTAGALALPSAASNSMTVKTTATNAQLQVQGNRNAADTADEVVIISTATRTAGALLGIWSNASVPVKKLTVDYQGLLQLVNTGALQPASIWTAITPTANWSANSGLAYWKDAGGVVHLKGNLQFGTGAAVTAFTLPVGFRPAPTFTRSFACSILGNGTTTLVQVLPDGTVQIPYVPLPVSTNIDMDCVQFLAEA